MRPLRFVLVVIVSAVAAAAAVDGAYANEVCHVERRNDVGLAEFRAGALNLRTDYDTWSSDECIERCCNYGEDAGYRCNAVSYYEANGEYGICQLLSCVPLDSCVWALAANFTAALVLRDVVEPDVNQSAAWNQSTVTSPGESTASAPTTLSASNSTPSGSLDLQDWNVIDGEVPSSQATVPSPDSAAVLGGTLSNNGSSNGSLSEDKGTALSDALQDAWNVIGLDPGDTNSTLDDITGNELTEGKMIPDIDNDWNVVDTGILPDNEQPTNSLDNGQQQQQPQPDANPFDEGPKDDWNYGVQDDEDDFWSIFGSQDDKFWSDEDDNSQSNETVAGAEAGQNRNDLEQPFNEPEQPSNQPEQQFDQPEQPFNEPEEPQQSFDDVRVTEEWQMENEEETPPPPHQDDAEESVVRRILMPSPGLIIGLCAALGVAFLVFIAVCWKVYQGQEWPKYKPIRSDYDTPYEPSGSSSALLP